MNNLEKMMVSLAGWVEFTEKNHEALSEMILFAQAGELPEVLPRIVEAAYGSPFCVVVAVDYEPKVTIFGADKSKFENFVLEKQLRASGSEMAGELRIIGEGALRKLDTREEEERLEGIMASEHFEHVELGDAVNRAAEIVERLSKDDSRAFLIVKEAEPRAGLFHFHQEDLQNYILGWHPEWMAIKKTWQEIEDTRFNGARLPLPLPLLRVRNLCMMVSLGCDEDRREALELIKGMGEEGSELLLEHLRDEKRSVRAGAARALGELGTAGAVPEIAAMILGSEEDRDEHPRPRLAGFHALVNLGDVSVGTLTEMLSNPEGDIRGLAIWALGKIGTEQAVRLIIDLLGDEEGFVRRDAALALGRIRARAAVDPLIESLNNDDPEVRWASAISLKKLGDRKALEPLRLLLEDEDEEVREGALEAIDGLSAA